MRRGTLIARQQDTEVSKETDMKAITRFAAITALVAFCAPALAQTAASAPPTRAQVKADTRKALANSQTPRATDEVP